MSLLTAVAGGIYTWQHWQDGTVSMRIPTALSVVDFRRRLALLAARLAAIKSLGPARRRHECGAPPRRGVDMGAVLRLHAVLGTAENGLQQADAVAGEDLAVRPLGFG